MSVVQFPRSSRPADAGQHRGDDDFGRSIHDALVYLNDPAHLQTHPLARFAMRQASGGIATVGKTLQQDLLEAIESLHPGIDAATAAQTRRCYQILRLHFVDGIDNLGVQRKLAISKSTYFRDYRCGMDAVTSIL